MKNSILLIIFLIFVATSTMGQNKSYGKKVDEKSAITVQQLNKNITGKTELLATVTGKVSSVCQAEGCWMKVDKGDGTTMMVRMKDHKFFLPKDISGKTAVFTGKATIKTTTIEMLRHYAEDEGKSPEYIASIKGPKTEMAFDATGVLIKN